eukprot:2360786-Amphidinium_carterae.1
MPISWHRAWNVAAESMSDDIPICYTNSQGRECSSCTQTDIALIEPIGHEQEPFMQTVALK